MTDGVTPPRPERFLELLNGVLRRNGRPEVAEADPALSLTGDLGLDSLGLAELTVRIEDEFGVDIFEQRTVRTLGEVVEQLPQDR